APGARAERVELPQRARQPAVHSASRRRTGAVRSIGRDELGTIRETVSVALDLGSLELAHQAIGRSTEPVPSGQAEHIGVEADHELSAGFTRAVGASRSGGITGNMLWGAGMLPNDVADLQANLGFGFGSSTEASFGNDAVSAAKRLFEFGGQRAYFDLLG